MSFDVSKTETFIPFLWILAKTILVVFMFNTIAVHPIATPSVREAVPSTVVSVFDRVVFMVILQLVVMERKFDMCIIKTSDVGLKIAHKTLVGLNIHVITDISVAFALRFFVREHATDAESIIIFPLFYVLWFVFGSAYFCLEILRHSPRSAQEDIPWAGSSSHWSRAHRRHTSRRSCISWAYSS